MKYTTVNGVTGFDGEKRSKKSNGKKYRLMSDIKIKSKTEGVVHELDAPTDMNMNVMELCKAYELPVEGTCGGMAMCIMSVLCNI